MRCCSPTCRIWCSTAPRWPPGCGRRRRGRSSRSAATAGRCAAVRRRARERGRRRARPRSPLRLVGVPDRFVAGEETALVNWLNGGPAKPTFTPPRPFERGVGGAPTLVQNVETLAHLALIARFGADWFRARRRRRTSRAARSSRSAARSGGPASTRSRSGCRSHELARRGPAGPTAPLRRFLVGGYFGTWIAAERRAHGVALARRRPRAARRDRSARARSSRCPASACGVVETARVARYLAAESAGQCGPCVHGLDAIAGALEQLAAAASRRSTRSGSRGSSAGSSRSAAAAPAAIPTAPFASSRARLRVFADERDRHARGSCSGDGTALPLPITDGRPAR